MKAGILEREDLNEVEAADDTVTDALTMLGEVADEEAVERIVEMSELLDGVVGIAESDEEVKWNGYGVITLYNVERRVYRECKLHISEKLIKDVMYCVDCNTVHVDAASTLAVKLLFLAELGIDIDMLVSFECMHQSCIETAIELELRQEVTDLLHGIAES